MVFSHGLRVHCIALVYIIVVLYILSFAIRQPMRSQIREHLAIDCTCLTMPALIHQDGYNTNLYHLTFIKVEYYVCFIISVMLSFTLLPAVLHPGA